MLFNYLPLFNQTNPIKITDLFCTAGLCLKATYCTRLWSFFGYALFVFVFVLNFVPDYRSKSTFFPLINDVCPPPPKKENKLKKTIQNPLHYKIIIILEKNNINVCKDANPDYYVKNI